MTEQPWARSRHVGNTISGVHHKVTQNNMKSAAKPKTTPGIVYATMIRYHWPFGDLQPHIVEEIRELEDFFGHVRRGEGSEIYLGRLVTTINHRIFGKTGEEALGFVRTLRSILDRYGVEIFTHDCRRIR